MRATTVHPSWENDEPENRGQFLSTAEVDVVFLDIHMPELNGFEILNGMIVRL